MNNNLIQSSSDALTKAGNVQQQISQKEFEIQLTEINSRYLSNNVVNVYYYNQQKKQLLEIEISSLKSQRDGYINTAIMYALTLAEKEIIEQNSFSSASVIIANICAFLKIQNITFSVTLPIMLKISTLYSRLQTNNSFKFASLKRELTNLKIQLQIQ